MHNSASAYTSRDFLCWFFVDSWLQSGSHWCFGFFLAILVILQAVSYWLYSGWFNSTAYNWVLFAYSFLCVACFQLYWLILAYALSCHVALNPLIQWCYLFCIVRDLLSNVLFIIFLVESILKFVICNWPFEWNWKTTIEVNYALKENMCVICVSRKENLWKRIYDVKICTDI